MKDVADALARLNELGRPDLAEPIHFLMGERDGLMKALASAKTVIESKDKAYSLIQQRWDAMRAKASTVDSERACNEMLTAEVDALRARVAELEPMAECAAIMAVCGYFSRMRGPDAWLDHGSWDEYPELFACAGVDLRSFQHGTRFYAGSAPAPAAQAVDAGTALSALSKAMQDDAGLAWSWHCNIAMTAQDAGAPHDRANVWAADFMRRAFDVDTLTRVREMPAAQAADVDAAIQTPASKMSDAEFHVVSWVGSEDACIEAQTYGPREDALREAMHYAALYATDAPVVVIEQVEVARLGYPDGNYSPTTTQPAAQAEAKVADDVVRDYPEGWVFHSADFSMAASCPARSGRVTLVRDLAGRDWWLSLSEEDSERVPLYVYGSGNTLSDAIKDAAMLAAKAKGE